MSAKNVEYDFVDSQLVFYYDIFDNECFHNTIQKQEIKTDLEKLQQSLTEILMKV